MKTLLEITKDMGDVFDDLRSGAIDLKTAAELANISGKIMKGFQLDREEREFLAGKQPHSPPSAREQQ